MGPQVKTLATQTRKPQSDLDPEVEGKQKPIPDIVF